MLVMYSSFIFLNLINLILMTRTQAFYFVKFINSYQLFIIKLLSRYSMWYIETLGINILDYFNILVTIFFIIVYTYNGSLDYLSVCRI